MSCSRASMARALMIFCFVMPAAVSIATCGLVKTRVVAQSREYPYRVAGAPKCRQPIRGLGAASGAVEGIRCVHSERRTTHRARGGDGEVVGLHQGSAVT